MLMAEPWFPSKRPALRGLVREMSQPDGLGKVPQHVFREPKAEQTCSLVEDKH